MSILEERKGEREGGNEGSGEKGQGVRKIVRELRYFTYTWLQPTQITKIECHLREM